MRQRGRSDGASRRTLASTQSHAPDLDSSRAHDSQEFPYPARNASASGQPIKFGTGYALSQLVSLNTQLQSFPLGAVSSSALGLRRISSMRMMASAISRIVILR
jgi:hypothetical protein